MSKKYYLIILFDLQFLIRFGSSRQAIILARISRVHREGTLTLTLILGAKQTSEKETTKPSKERKAVSTLNSVLQRVSGLQVSAAMMVAVAGGERRECKMQNLKPRI